MKLVSPDSDQRLVTRVAQAYNEIAGAYDAEYHHPKDIAENKLVMQLLEEGGFLKGSVLDAGCGTGFLLDQAGPYMNPLRYLGIDVSDGMLARAREKYPRHSFHLRDMGDTGLHNACCDVIVSLFGCFNYCPDLYATVLELHRLLRTGGRIFLLLYSPARVKRSSYILKDKDGNQVQRTLCNTAQVRELLDTKFKDIKVSGMSRTIDYLPTWLPQWFFNAWQALEAATIGRWRPDACYYLAVSAIKR